MCSFKSRRFLRRSLIETLNAQAEVEPLLALAEQLKALRVSGPNALQAYLRNVRLRLYTYAQNIVREVER